MNDLKTNLELPQLGKTLLSRVRNRNIVQDEFDKECAYWMTGFFTDYVFTPYPSQPVEIMRYLERKKDNIRYEVKDEFWRHSQIQDYFKENQRVIAKNIGNLHWLEFMKKHIPLKDTINHKRIEKVLETYPKDLTKGIG